MPCIKKSGFVNNEFIQIFKPFHCIDIIFCTQTYKISRRNKVVPITKKNIIFLILMNILLAIIFYVIFSIDDLVKKSSNSILYFSTYFLYIVGFVLTSIVHVYQYKTAFTLLTKLEKLIRCIKNPNDTLLLKNMTRTSSWILMVSTILIILVKILVLGTKWLWTKFLITLTAIMLEMKLLNVACILHFLTRKMKKWTDIVLICENDEDLGTPSQAMLNDMKSTFLVILDAYNLIKKYFQVMIVIHFAVEFFQLLLFMGILVTNNIKASQGDLAQIIQKSIGVLFWFAKGLVVESFSCSAFETFYSEIKSTRFKVINKTYMDSRQELKRFGKNVVRTIDTSFSQLEACGMFPVDITSPLQLGSLATTYILVLLQFAV